MEHRVSEVPLPEAGTQYSIHGLFQPHAARTLQPFLLPTPLQLHQVDWSLQLSCYPPEQIDQLIKTDDAEPQRAPHDFDPT